MLREFLPFSPVRITSPSHLDEMETRDSNMHDRRWHSNTLNELFKVAHDFLELIQIYKAISKLPAGPMMGFGLYLVSFIGIYALHFPQMDIEGLVFGKDSESALDFEHQVRIVDALRILAYVRDHLPMAEYWFRTLHRAHKYYKQLNLEQKSNQFAAVNRNTSGKDAKTDPIGSLDTVFQEFGMVEDETISFVMQKEEFNRLSGFTDRVSSPQPVWKPVNANSGASRHIDPLARPAPQVGPQDHAPWYQKRGDHIAQPRISPEYDQPSPYGIPPNTLPPINSTGTLHAYPSTSPPGLSFKPSQSGVILCFSGEDVALFVDARSDKDIAAIQTGWTMIKDDKEPSITGSPNRRSQELRKMQTIGAGWVGVLWQWC